MSRRSPARSRVVGENADARPRTVLVPLLADVEATVARVASLKALRPEQRVVVSLLAADASVVQRLAEAGADAFVAGIDPPRAEDVVAEPTFAPDDPAAAFGLTAREVEVLRFLTAGFSNKEVARRLDVSVRTVETHRFNLRRKTQAGRLKDLVGLARRMGLPPAGEGLVEPSLILRG